MPTPVPGGRRNREIAAELGITERTIKVHRGRAMKKLGVQKLWTLLGKVKRNAPQLPGR
jgi:DNA-binding NarL/FixJ family response regulator